MANNAVLIMGDSGTGKSTSLRNLDPSETFIINVLDKKLPFRGAKEKYQQKEGGNYFPTDNSEKIVKIINTINEKRPEIKNIVIDDFQYILSNEYMRRLREKSYEKYNDISHHVKIIFDKIVSTRDDLFCFILSHSEPDEITGKIKFKTIGKAIDKYIKVEGMFTYVFHSLTIDGQYKFLTNTDGTHIAKTPMDMFQDLYIENDINEVKKQILNYEGN